MKQVLSTLLGLAALAAAQDVPRLAKDKTGLAWVEPFDHALAAAKERGRLLMIKPVAFGTTPDGCW